MTSVRTLPSVTVGRDLAFPNYCPRSQGLHQWAWQDPAKSSFTQESQQAPGAQWSPGHRGYGAEGALFPGRHGPEARLTLPQMHLLEGSVGVHGSLAYVPQQAWIIEGSVRENILMGSQYDEAW